MEHDPKARLVCVDLWEPEKTYRGTAHQALTLEKCVYEKCVRNLWPYRDRAILVKASTTKGLEAIHLNGLQPDLIYVDAGHDYEQVSRDLQACRHLFPWAKVVGDDWQHEPIRKAVAEVAKAEAMSIEQEGRYCWGLVEHGTRQPQTYAQEYAVLPVAGRRVFDWGADWGSTARWFLNRGAKQVVASESRERDLERLRRYAAIEPRITPVGKILDPMMLSAVLNTCDVAKVDVEGAERFLLDVPDSAISGIRSWVIETHSAAVNVRLQNKYERLGFTWRDVRVFANNPAVKVVAACR